MRAASAPSPAHPKPWVADQTHQSWPADDSARPQQARPSTVMACLLHSVILPILQQRVALIQDRAWSARNGAPHAVSAPVPIARGAGATEA